MKEGKAGLYVQCLPCGITEALDKDKQHVNKREQQKLVKQYAKQESIGSNLGDLLKAAMEKKGTSAPERVWSKLNAAEQPAQSIACLYL